MTPRDSERGNESEDGTERETVDREERTREGSVADDPATPEDGEDRDEYADWSLPGQPASGHDESADSTGDDVPPVPPEVREPLLRDRFRERLGVTQRQWFVIESVLLVLPYPLFILAYLALDTNETLFLALTLAYSLFAMYVGFLS